MFYQMWMISNRQPWPEALLRGWITCKTRSAAVTLPPVGSTVILHASKALWQPWRDLPWTDGLDVRNLPRGGAVGIARISAIAPSYELISRDERVQYFRVKCDYGPGFWSCADEWAMRFENVQRIPFIPCRGAQVPTRKIPAPVSEWLESLSKADFMALMG